MKMIRSLFLAILTYPSLIAYSQVGVIDNQVQAQTYPGSEVYSVPIRAPRLKGSVFLYDDWTIGSIFLKTGKEILERPFRYNLLGQELLYMDNQKMYGVKLNSVEEFNLLTPEGFYVEFVVNSSWTFDGVTKAGVYQKLSQTIDQQFALVKSVDLVFIKSNYNIALDAGEKDDRYVQKETLYFLNVATQSLEEVPRGKKKILKYFNNDQVDSYVDSNKVNLKEEHGLISIVQYANSLIVSN